MDSLQDDEAARGEGRQCSKSARRVHAVDPGFQNVGIVPPVRIGREAEPFAGRCHVNHRVTSLWAPTPEIMQRSSLAATVSSRRRGIGGVFGGRPDGVGR